MTLDPSNELTQWLHQLQEDPSSVSGEPMARIYEELKCLARSRLRGADHGSTLQATALVNEAWLKLQGKELQFENRRQYFFLASRAMRSVLVDHARAKAADKRGGGVSRVTCTGHEGSHQEHPLDVLFLDESLRRLEAIDPDLCKVVELRYFGGLEHAEIGEALGVPLRTVQRRWQLARAWLKSELDRQS